MEDEELFQLLVALMDKLSIEVVRKNLYNEEFKILSGSCKVQGQNLLIIDKRCSLKEQISFLSQELSRHDLENIFVPPILREFIEKT